MARKKKPSRIIFGYKKKNYKFVSFFVDKKDNSFYFHLYRKLGETLMSSGKSNNDESVKHIRFSEFKPTNFEENKISFHESGYIHSTDKYGHRYKDKVVGIPFREVDSFMFILVLAPRNPKELIEIHTIDDTRDILIKLPDTIHPFMVHFAIIKKGSSLLPLIPKNQNILSGLIHCYYDDKEHGLLIALTKVINKTGKDRIDWPPFTLILKRTG